MEAAKRERNSRPDAFVENSAGEHALFDCGSDAPAASNRIDGAEMMTVAALHLSAATHVYAERSAE